MNSNMKADTNEAVSRECHPVTNGSREAYKRMTIRPHPLITARLLLSPLLLSIFTASAYRGPGLLPLDAMARCSHKGIDLLCTICCIPPS